MTEAELKKERAALTILIDQCEDAIDVMLDVKSVHVKRREELQKQLDVFEEERKIADKKEKLDCVCGWITSKGITAIQKVKGKDLSIELPITESYKKLSVNYYNKKITVYGCPTSFLGSRMEMWKVVGLTNMPVNEKSIDRIMNKLYNKG